MVRRQTRVPKQWLVTDERIGGDLLEAIRRLPPGSGVLVLHHDLPARKRQRLLRQIRQMGRLRRLVIVDEAGGRVARVHGAVEIRQARLAGAELLFLSPIFATRSHPRWTPLPQMRAAALVRLAKVPVIALGGMDAARFRTIGDMGFAGWAGIDAWRLKSLKSHGRTTKS